MYECEHTFVCRYVCLCIYVFVLISQETNHTLEVNELLCMPW